MTETTINIGSDFSPFPGGRVKLDGPFSGQEFRDDYLVPALKANDRVHVIIDSAFGYGSSFLEECFGGLVRSCGFRLEDLEGKLVLEHEKPGFEYYVKDIWQYIADADIQERKRA